MSLTVGELFAGIGGIGLGLERAGMRVVWQVERDPFCRRVLAKHWPSVQRFDDVRHVGAHNLQRVRLIGGGFPCQDVSNAGPKLGLAGERSSLWFEFERILDELRPDYALVENVAALVHRGLGTVLGALSELGYDAEWSNLPACALGAPHTRQRLFIVAYARRLGISGLLEGFDPRTLGQGRTIGTPSLHHWSADWRDRPWLGGGRESLLCGVADRPAGWVDRLRAVGNAVVPQVSEYIGRRILAYHESLNQAGAA